MHEITATRSRGVQSLCMSLRTDSSAATKVLITRVAFFRARTATEVQLELGLYLIVVYASSVRLVFEICCKVH
jgi:hypothetical protein